MQLRDATVNLWINGTWVFSIAQWVHSTFVTLETLWNLKDVPKLYAKSFPVFTLLGTVDKPLFCTRWWNYFFLSSERQRIQICVSHVTAALRSSQAILVLIRQRRRISASEEALSCYDFTRGKFTPRGIFSAPIQKIKPGEINHVKGPLCLGRRVHPVAFRHRACHNVREEPALQHDLPRKTHQYQEDGKLLKQMDAGILRSAELFCTEHFACAVCSELPG